MKVVAYYRYSTDNQAQVDNSEARQQKYVEEMIVRNGWVLVDTVVDRAKSGDDRKPELMKLKERLHAGGIQFDCICIDDPSRISRKDILKIHEDIGWLADSGKRLAINSRGGKPELVSELTRDLKQAQKQAQACHPYYL